MDVVASTPSGGTIYLNTINPGDAGPGGDLETRAFPKSGKPHRYLNHKRLLGRSGNGCQLDYD